MRSLVQNRPLLGAALCFAAGIHCGVVTGWPLAVFGLLTAVACLVGVMRMRRDRKPMAILVALILLLGALVSSTARCGWREAAGRAAARCKGAKTFTVVVADEPMQVADKWRIPLWIEAAGERRVPQIRGEGMLAKVAAPLTPGTVLSVQGHWRPGFSEKWPGRQERQAILGTLTMTRMTVVGRRTGWYERLFWIKTGLKAVGQKTLPPREAATLHAMVYGDDPVDTDLTEAMRRVGVVHLLTVSGLHVGFLVMLLMGCGAGLCLPRRFLCLLVMLFVAVYIVMVGARPPAVRAGLMTGLLLWGMARERSTDGLNLLAAAALIMLIRRPLDLYDPGFQLSFAACAGIGGLFPRWRRHSPARWCQLTDPLLVSLAAQVGVAPVLAYYFATLSWVSILVNPLIVPLGSLAVQLGMVAEVLGSIWLPAGAAINVCTGLLLRLISTVVAGVDRWAEPWAISITIWWAMLLLVAGVWLATWGPPANPVTGKRRSWPILAWVLLLSGLLLVPVVNVTSRPAGRGMTVEIFSVGQGDSILITSPEGRRILIDGGEQEAYYRVLRPYLREHGIRRLDMVVVTHAHADHLGGITLLLKDAGVQIGRVLEPGVLHNTELYRDFLRQVKTRRIPYATARRGMKFRLGRQVTGEVLWPLRSGGVYQELNNSSIVLRVEYGSWRVLLTGDAGLTVEKQLLALEGARLRAHLFKVGHHGSRDAGGADFLRRVGPKAAVICVGRENPFGHPAPETLIQLRRAGATLYRTDRYGHICARFTDNKLNIYREVTP